MSNESLGGDEFGVHEISAMVFANGSEWRIGNVFHGSQK
jgi:hypothetical protein